MLIGQCMLLGFWDKALASFVDNYSPFDKEHVACYKA